MSGLDDAIKDAQEGALGQVLSGELVCPSCESPERRKCAKGGTPHDFIELGPTSPFSCCKDPWHGAFGPLRGGES